MCAWTDNLSFTVVLLDISGCECHQAVVMHEEANSLHLFRSITAALV